MSSTNHTEEAVLRFPFEHMKAHVYADVALGDAVVRPANKNEIQVWIGRFPDSAFFFNTNEFVEYLEKLLDDSKRIQLKQVSKGGSL